MERVLSRLGGERIRRSDWDLTRLPPHLRLSFLVVDDEDRVLAQGKDLDAIKARLAGEVRGAIASVGAAVERRGFTEWSFGEIERMVEHEHGGHIVKGYPALHDEGDSVAIRMLDNPIDQRVAMWEGNRRLLRLAIPFSRKSALAQLTNDSRLALGWSPYPTVSGLIDDAVECAIDELITQAGGPAWDAVGFDKLLASVRAGLKPLVFEIMRDAARVLAASREVGRRLEELHSPIPAVVAADVAAQREALVYDGFVSGVGRQRLPDLVRYLRAMVMRLDKQPDAPVRDRQNMETVHRVQAAYNRLLDSYGPDVVPDEAVIEIAWMIEELRVSLFAQSLGTPRSISEKRILQAIATTSP
jgi:ATP-dependent helicase HrpA